ncbi:MAG: ABC-ATPase domain-containing protein, partial [Lachnospiraceae bacterium]|nr:ABC-ATPase domain-containing protein [Lachnospiraceae bacterium]
LRRPREARGLAAFVADGSGLPRESGVASRPMKGAVPFRAPESLAVTMQLPHAGARRGMGIPRGITMIAGGGYHGKSTLLKALELGVYNHIAGDGREYVVTDSGAMKLRAEDGRSITSVDISMFIRNLPNGKDTARFSTEDASGSTSQAANVVEAMEAGSRVFLIDEDTSATNFMIRDELMQRVINRESEPIIPFIDRVEELYRTFGISTILVAGSCGSYFHRADHIIQMKQYQPVDITELAKREAAAFPLQTEAPDAAAKPNFARRVRCTQRLEDRVKVRSSGVDSVSIDREVVDLRYVEQLADPEQVNLLGQILKYAIQNLMDGKRTVTEIVDAVEAVLKARGMEGICGGKFLPAGYALPRRQEIAACINRYRRLRV